MIEPIKKSEKVEVGSERSFGLVFAAVFAVFAFWPLVSGEGPRLWGIVVALGLLGISYIRPALLRPLNIAWFRLGLFLGTVVTPVIMALLYVTAFLPTSLVLRLAGKDPLGLKREPHRATYWIVREYSGSAQEGMNHQF